MGEQGKGTGNMKHKWYIQNRQGEMRNSMGNGGAEELICMTHGHELRGGTRGNGGTRKRGKMGRNNWDNCNHIIKKYAYK